MRKASVAIVCGGLAGSLLVLAASCGGTRGSSDVPPVVQIKTAAPSVSSTGPEAKAPDLRDPKQVSVSAWTDDQAIAALAQDCRWDPGDCVTLIEKAAPESVDAIDYLPEGRARPEGDQRVLPPEACRGLFPLACARVPAQSCAPDGCAQMDYGCYPECDRTCAGCAGKCVEGCESCKSTCKDDACRLTCARSCGECRQGCLTVLDHCATVTCTEKAETCYKERDDAWMKTACPKVCPKVQDCVEKCPEIEGESLFEHFKNACAQACMKKHGKGCPGDWMAICVGEPNASAAFWEYHRNRHGGDN